MKNTLGHDKESEMLTIIARLRENRFKIDYFDNNEIRFTITLEYCSIIPVPNTSIQNIKFIINRTIYDDIYKYFLKQINGVDKRELQFLDGYIIWGLLEEKLNNIMNN